jgi:hypothetical protein
MNSAEKSAYWQHQRQAHQRSGLTIRAFCQREQIALATFQYWLRKLDKDEPSPVASVALIPLQLCEEPTQAQAATLTITAPSGWQLTFPASISPETLRPLLAVLL